MSNLRSITLGKWATILGNFGLTERQLSGKHCPCPLCGGEDRFRFDNLEDRGTYICTACGAGDGIKLAMGILGLSFRETAARIESMVGSIAVNAQSKPKQDDEHKRLALRQAWVESAPITEGDVAWQYLKGRGLSLAIMPINLRLHPGMAYFDDGKVVGTFPTMLGAVKGADSAGVSIHRTYLHQGRKAPVSAPKKLMAGLPIAGGAIRLAAATDTVAIAEGIETSLAAQQMFGLPVWSTLNASGLAGFIPPEGVKQVVIFGDNDLNFVGQSAAYSLAQRLARDGFATEVHIPRRGGDDWLDDMARGR